MIGIISSSIKKSSWLAKNEVVGGNEDNVLIK